MAMNDEMFEAILKRFDAMNARFEQMETSMNQRFAELIAKLDNNIVNMNQSHVAVDARTVMEETNIEVNRIELSLENNEMKSHSGTPTTTNYECKEIINVDISEHEVIDEQPDLEIVNDTEVDWDEEIVFDHSNIESKPIITEQQLTGVKCLLLPSKYSSESLSSTAQQESNAMKYVATDVEVSSANVLNVETELNSFAQYEVILPRKVWDPGSDIMLL